MGIIVPMGIVPVGRLGSDQPPRYGEAKVRTLFGRQHERMAASTRLAHSVYFTLKDNSPEATRQLVDACHSLLTDHPGTVFFAAGVRAEELKRKVNDREFDVALHVVFEDQQSHDQYQEAPRHRQFIEENQSNWQAVRVFDALV